MEHDGPIATPSFWIRFAFFVLLALLAIASVGGFLYTAFLGEAFWPLILVAFGFAMLARRLFLLTAEAA